MSTPESQQGNEARRHREHLRPARFSKEVRLPLAVRKELLLTRAALERHDCYQALQDVKGGARRFGSIANWLPRAVRPRSLMKVLGIAHDYPLVSTAITLALPLVKRTPLPRWAWKLSKAGLVAGAAYWAYNTWVGATKPGVHQDSEDVSAQPVDTGFRDPLVR